MIVHTKLRTTGRVFFALGLLGLGASHFYFQEFMTGRAPPWPGGPAGQTIWAYGTGAAFIGIAVAILSGRWGRAAAVSAAGLILGWALLRKLPVAAQDTLFGGAWTNAGKALTFVGGALAVAATLPPVGSAAGEPLRRFLNRTATFTATGRVILGLFFLLTGTQHFLHTPFVASLIPPWFPGDPVLWTYFGGVALLAGGAGLQLPGTARLAAFLSGTMVFSWFWIIHLPRTFASVSDGIAVFEALAVAGIAFVLAGSLAAEAPERGADAGTSGWDDTVGRRAQTGPPVRSRSSQTTL
jgi:uncharacterized membrane protein